MRNESKSLPGIVIAGTHSSVGKSSVAIGFMRLLKKRGWKIKPFKVGPDYIDPSHHKRACGQPSYNLDTVMCTKNYVKNLFRDIMCAGDLAIIEGVMGLHDGALPKSEKGSTAEIAKLLNLPVLLVIDGRTMSRSSAALVLGFMKLDPKLNLKGVIANNISSARHANIIKNAVEYYTPAKLLACLPTSPELSIPSRHLGLQQSFEQEDDIYLRWEKHIESYIDLKIFLKLFKLKKPLPPVSSAKQKPKRWGIKERSRSYNIAIAKDEAFQFIYQDTLDFLDHHGCNIFFFSPLHDAHLPPNMDGYYFPGGYPELHAEALSKNYTVLKEVKKAGSVGKMIIGECGGLMYLGKHITNSRGKKFPMAGLFNFATSIKTKNLTLGYRKLRPAKISDRNKNIILRGHEFHYSNFTVNSEHTRWNNSRRKKDVILKDGYRTKNCHSFYMHIYWACNKKWLNYLTSSQL